MVISIAHHKPAALQAMIKIIKRAIRAPIGSILSYVNNIVKTPKHMAYK
jgi:hypothetical protein